MTRVGIFIMLLVLVLVGAVPTGADQLTAIEIFEGMVYYENDQLETHPSTRDFHCIITQSIERAGARSVEVMEKDFWFLAPLFQLHAVDGEPTHYFDNDALIVTLESVDLERLRDTEIDGVDCYVIRTTPLDPAFRRFYKVYYVAKEGFRHVRTESRGSSSDFDDITTVINYAYTEVNSFMLLSETVAETSNEEGDLLYTVTATYTGYEFGLGLDVQYFVDFLADYRPNPIWN